MTRWGLRRLREFALWMYWRCERKGNHEWADRWLQVARNYERYLRELG